MGNAVEDPNHDRRKTKRASARPAPDARRPVGEDRSRNERARELPTLSERVLEELDRGDFEPGEDPIAVAAKRALWTVFQAERDSADDTWFCTRAFREYAWLAAGEPGEPDGVASAEIILRREFMACVVTTEYRAALCRCARNHLPDEWDPIERSECAEDIVSEAISDLLDGSLKLPESWAKLRSFMFGVVKNRDRHVCRDAGWLTPLDLSMEDARSKNPTDPVERGRAVLLSNDVDSAFEDMSPAMQAVNRSYFLEDAKAKEIAEDRGVSEATVRADPEGSEAPARKPRRLEFDRGRRVVS
jgi:RNA polymerase sigma factor (sigma-70 family)